MMVGSSHAHEIASDAITIPQFWKRNIPPGAYLQINGVLPARMVDGEPTHEVPEVGHAEGIFVHTEQGGEITMRGDIPLTASEAGIDLGLIPAVLDAAVDAVTRHPSICVEDHGIRELREALIAVGYLPSEVKP